MGVIFAPTVVKPVVFTPFLNNLYPQKTVFIPIENKKRTTFALEKEPNT